MVYDLLVKPQKDCFLCYREWKHYFLFMCLGHLQNQKCRKGTNFQTDVLWALFLRFFNVSLFFLMKFFKHCTKPCEIILIFRNYFFIYFINYQTIPREILRNPTAVEKVWLWKMLLFVKSLRKDSIKLLLFEKQSRTHITC